MLMKPEIRLEDQARRLELKSQDQRLKVLAVEGTRLSPWEAKVLVDMAREVYFNEPGIGPLRSGQTRFECVATNEGAGKPIKECRMSTVVLTLHDQKDDLEIWRTQGQAAVRRLLIQRMTEEAREQGGLLSQEDLALLLFCDVRTIRRDIRELREQKGIFVATRGQIQDIGPGVSHKGVAIGHWLSGLEPVEIAQRINHTLHAVERYIHTFCRVVFLRRKAFHELQIALTVGISSGGTRSFLEIYEAHRNKPEYKRRFQEIDLIGEQHFEAEDLKKGGPTLEPETSSTSRRL
jgi:hypothetical protein